MSLDLKEILDRVAWMTWDEQIELFERICEYVGEPFASTQIYKNKNFHQEKLQLQKALDGISVAYDHKKLLHQMYESNEHEGLNGKILKIDESTCISPLQGRLLFDLTQKLKAQYTLEIGLAYGFSTAWIMAAHKETGASQ